MEEGLEVIENDTGKSVESSHEVGDRICGIACNRMVISVISVKSVGENITAFSRNHIKSLLLKISGEPLFF